ncbi:MAG TPA: T9SS type A sorting domain-containing protein, partial [Chitinophagaceae bacterium]|nr:T9SS type A sorting domain-containing protein [Chitinophagaceae bacterium]
PIVTSINRQSPGTETTDATSVTYRATFSESVTGVNATDFTLTTSGVTGTIASVTTISNSIYDINVNSVSGNGTIRLDLKTSGTGITDAAGNIISGGYTNGQIYTINQTSPPGPGFATVTALNSVSITAITGEKPQSKVWNYNGKFWSVLANSAGTYLYRLDGTTWTNMLKLSTRTTSEADCKMVGSVTHILLYQGTSSQLVSVEYVAASSTYQLWSSRPSTISISLDAGVETAVIDMDGNGRMWLASAGTNNINVRWSDAPYTTWSSPITIATGVNDDDICDVIYMPVSGKIGVLWSNQNTERFGFKTHSNGANPSTWSADEVPASQSAINFGAGMADDHLNFALASDGTLYCAVKTSYDATGYPKIALLVRRPGGTWDNLYEVSQSGTRGIVILNEAVGKLRVIYTSVENGGNIIYKETSTSGISFSSAKTLIQGTFNDATSTKENFSSDIVILASNSSQAVGVLATDNAPAFATTITSNSQATQRIVSGEALKAYPNPFSSEATIKFVLPESGAYTLSLYDMKGVQIAILKQGKGVAGELNTVTVDGFKLAQGIYIVKLQTIRDVKTFKLLQSK